MGAFCFRKCIWAYSILMLIPELSLIGQTRPNNLLDFVNAAKNHIPALKQKKALVDAAKSGITDARHAFLPNAFVGDELNLGTDNSLPGSYLSYGIIPSTSSGIHATNNYQSAVGNIAIFQSDYELLDFGLKKARIDNARAFTNVRQADFNREAYFLEWQTGKLYFELLKNQFQLGIDLQNVHRYEAIFKVIQALTQSGIKAGADSSLAMAELSRSRITYNQTLGQLNQLQQQMSYLTGIPVADIQIDSSRTDNYLSALDIIGKGQPADSALNPITDYYLQQKLFDQQTEVLARKSFLPKVFVTASAWGRGSSIDYNSNYKALSEGLGYQRFNYMVGATFVYDLFNGVHRKDKLDISHFNLLASSYNLEQQQLSLRNIDNQADEAIKTSVKNLFEVPVQIKASQDTYDQKTAQFKAGLINLIDLTNASFVLYRSQSDYVQTLSDWLLANLDKSAATGTLDSFIQSIK